MTHAMGGVAGLINTGRHVPSVAGNVTKGFGKGIDSKLSRSQSNAKQTCSVNDFFY